MPTCYKNKICILDFGLGRKYLFNPVQNNIATSKYKGILFFKEVKNNQKKTGHR